MAIDINSLIKQYENPWDTSFSYLDASGNNLGTGYDSYQDAIRKLAFTTGVKQYDPYEGVKVLNSNEQSSWEETVGAHQGGWGYSPFFDAGSPTGGSDERTSWAPTPENPGQLFGTQQELYDYLLKQPGSPLSYESREKYGRDLTEGQLQNMYALLSSPSGAQVINAYKGVPDWDYHRAAYEAAYNPVAGINISGEKALIGSTPVFGDDGRITGYKVNLNPEHINLADTSGRVQSSTQGSTTFNQNLRDYAIPVDANTAFIPLENVSKFGYKSGGSSAYEKAPTMASSLGEMFTKGFLGAAAGGAFGFGPLAGGNAVGGAAGTAGTGGSMFEGLGDWFSNLFGDSGAAAEGLSDSFWSDWMSSGGGDLGSGISGATDWLGSGLQSGGGITGISPTTAISGITGDIPGLGTLTEGGMLIPAAGGAAVPISSLGSGFLSSLYQQAVNDPMGTAAKAYRALQGTGLLSGGMNILGGYLQGQAAGNAADKAANAQIEAARIAADAAKFKPVGVTTRFGQSQFTKDAQGNVVSAGYNVTPDIKAMQDSLIGSAPGMLSQFTGSQAATAPMGDAAQRMMALGNQYLAADPQAQAKLFYDQQQAIMATERARQEAGTLTDEFNRGTYGLATGGTGMMGAANPRMEAMYNAQRQQDLQAAYDATKGGQQYATFGSGMVGAGGDMLKNMYGTQVASLDPWKAAMGGAQYIEGLGQNALDLSINMGKVASPAESGRLMAQGMTNAANIQQGAATSPWGDILMGGANWMNNMATPQQQNPTYDPSRFRLVPFGS